jgi:hypothetical protein
MRSKDDRSEVSFLVQEAIDLKQVLPDFVANMASYAICSEFDFGDS